jgi:aspartate aminotransferase
MLSQRVAGLKPSPTLSLTAKVAELKKQGQDIVSFGAGEPDFGTPEEVCDAGIEAIRGGKTRYTAGSGIPELRAAIAEKLEAENRVKVAPTQVVVSCGAKHSVFNALMTLCDPGDEVVLFAPYWMTYRDQVYLAGGRAKVVYTDRAGGYLPDPEAFEDAITPQTKAVIINSPSNPTGTVMPRKTFERIAEISVERNLYVISDEIYEKLIYDGQDHVSIASLDPEIAKRTVTVNGVSKSHAMTGWRIGYAAAAPEIARGMSALQDQVTSNPTSISQYAALVALTMPCAKIEANCKDFQARRDLILGELAKVPHVECIRPHGAFYAFADISSYCDASRDDLAISLTLLENFNVACVPGSVFEGPGHLRLTYALSRDDIVEGVRRIAEGLKSLA